MWHNNSHAFVRAFFANSATLLLSYFVLIFCHKSPITLLFCPMTTLLTLICTMTIGYFIYLLLFFAHIFGFEIFIALLFFLVLTPILKSLAILSLIFMFGPAFLYLISSILKIFK